MVLELMDMSFSVALSSISKSIRLSHDIFVSSSVAYDKSSDFSTTVFLQPGLFRMQET